MNWEHLKVFLWLRWRLISNRNRRAGTGAVIIQGIFTVIMLSAGVFAFFGGIAAGYLPLSKASPAAFMYVWDGVVIGFLFFWMVELLIELQRSELLALDKFLHLPVSLSGAFLINYIGSISSLGIVIFMPLMLGLSIGLVFSKGPIMLLMFPLIVAFALMITALTHQFRGWIASLMVNQRRRRTVVTIATFAFILITQIPSIIGITSGRLSRSRTSPTQAVRREIETLDNLLARREITKQEYAHRVRAIQGPPPEQDEQQIYETIKAVNTFVPLGWLARGATAGFEGNVWPGLLGMAGLTLIGAASLRRSYHTTLRLYTGQFTGAVPSVPAVSSVPEAAPVSAAPAKRPKQYPAAFLEKQIPRLTEHASAIAVASFRSLLRAPEAKMLLLTPLIMLFIFGGMTFNQGSNPPEFARPLIATGGFAFMLFMMVGLLGNQFGFDRSGFRVFVLSSAPRKDILLGKNVATAPFGIGFMALVAIVLQILSPMRVDHFLAVLLQMVPMYLLYCLMGNALSIIAPMPMASGSLKPVKPRGIVILIHLAFMFLFPIAMVPTLIPLGIEYLLTWTNSWAWFPGYLIFTIVEFVLVVWLYVRILEAQGRLLERREQKILETVTDKVE